MAQDTEFFRYTATEICSRRIPAFAGIPRGWGVLSVSPW